MAAPTVLASANTNPGGTGSTLTVTLPTHAANDLLVIMVQNTGNVTWTIPAGWTLIDQRTVGTASTGIVGTWFAKKASSSSETNPACTLGATVTRAAIAWTVRGADVEGPFTLPEYSARGFATGTANPVRPPTVTTLAPEMLVLHGYGSRTATNAPDPSLYTQDQEVVISGTLTLNGARQTITAAQTSLANQDASPTSGVRWAAGILCIPSPDYVYYRSGSQALTASGTSATPTLPTGTSSSDWRSNKDCLIATIEAAGTPTISPQVGADWTEITGWATTTSGNGTTIKKYWALYDGSINTQFNRSTTGEIFVYLSTYRNTDQVSPIGNVATQQNASSTTSTFPALSRAESKSTVQITCVANGTPTFTSPANWTERNDSNGISCSDQAFDTIATVSSGSFTLSVADDTAAGSMEILSVSGAPAGVEMELIGSPYGHLGQTQMMQLIVH